MNASTGQTAPRERTVGDIAATVPGATAVFRKYKIDFCCNGDIPLAEAARRRGVDPGEVEGALAALEGSPGMTATASVLETGELIELIQNHYHEAHRRALPELIALSRRVEAVHRQHPKAPAGLSETLQRMEDVLEQHMRREETTLFPAMRQYAAGTLDTAIGELRHEHDDQREFLHRIEDITDNLTLPEGACRSWQALYVGTGQLVEDLMEHIHMENNVLFPRFAAARQEA